MNIRVHGEPATLHLEKLSIKSITITVGILGTRVNPQLLKVVEADTLGPIPFTLHRYPMGETLDVCDVFEWSSETDSLKVILVPNGFQAESTEGR